MCVRHLIESEQQYSFWKDFSLSPSHFVNFLTAQEKQNRPLTELKCFALTVDVPAVIRL